MRNLVICFCTLIIAICTCACESNNDVIEHQTGVWVSDKAELLLTDKIMMYFEKQSDDAVLVMLKVDSITKIARFSVKIQSSDNLFPKTLQ